MFEVIKSEYGKELGVFEFDYLGEHSSLDAVLINSKIKFYEKGLHISTGLSSKSLFVEWGCIKGITCTKSRQTLIILKTDKGVMKLKKEKKETDISQFKRMLKTHVPGIEIEYVKASPDNLRSIELKRAEKLYEEVAWPKMNRGVFPKMSVGPFKNAINKEKLFVRQQIFLAMTRTV